MREAMDEMSKLMGDNSSSNNNNNNKNNNNSSSSSSSSSNNGSNSNNGRSNISDSNIDKRKKSRASDLDQDRHSDRP